MDRDIEILEFMITVKKNGKNVGRERGLEIIS